jgi:hypothetical protein
LIEQHDSWSIILNDETERRVVQLLISQNSSCFRVGIDVRMARGRGPAALGRNGRGRDALVREHVMRKDKIENPGFDKLRAIAIAMGFPLETWFE